MTTYDVLFQKTIGLANRTGGLRNDVVRRLAAINGGLA